MLDAGRLRDRVTIQTRSVTRDAYGAEVVTWATLATVWASVETLSGREYLATISGGIPQVRSERLSRVVIRYRSDVREYMQIVYGNRTLRIEQVLEAERREALHLMCSEANEVTA